jgi:hypothetical protein
MEHGEKVEAFGDEQGTLIFGLTPKMADGIQFQDPHQTLVVRHIMDGFVDDTTIWQNLFNGLDSLYQGSIQEIATRLQTAAQWWEQLLHATGGQLAPLGI